MPHGGPDWGTTGPLKAIFTVDDLGEHAVRLGSIVGYDRRGNVVLLDDFEGPIIKWNPLPPALGTIILSSTNPYSGCQALEATALGDGAAFIVKRFSVLGSTRLGIEVSFAGTDVTFRNLEFIIQVAYLSGAYYCWGQMDIDLGTHKLYIWKDGVVHTEIADIGPLIIAPFTYYTVKLVVDFDAGTYVRAEFANQEYDISQYKLEKGASDAAAYFEPTIGFWNGSPITDSLAYMDDVIITQNEP